MSKTTKEFAKYCLIGVINTLVGISTAFICLNILGISYSVATAAAYITGSIVSFLLNKKYTFKNKGSIFAQFIKFFTTMLPAYIFSYYTGFLIAKKYYSAPYIIDVLQFLHTHTNTSMRTLTDDFGVLISMVIYLFVGFIINKFFVFKKC
ncbi:MAG: GtrA family protein [Candidatus Gastranaerophilaceae bacterium]